MPCMEDCWQNARGDFDHVHSKAVPVAEDVPTPSEAIASRCNGWSVWLGSCTLAAGHSGKHVDTYGDTFRATPRKAAVR
jgi:hypothetical protein